jgi:hypothetical protein
MAEFTLGLIREGLPVDEHTAPDISVGMLWGNYWAKYCLDEKHGKRITHPHVFPDYFPQAAANPVDAWVYPDAALADFRRWFRDEYVPQAFPEYIKRKEDKKQLAPAVAHRLIGAAQGGKLLPSSATK